jgi:hypothetical protein
MQKNPLHPILLLGLIWILVSLACSTASAPTATPAPTKVPATATATLKPTATYIPTATANATQTQAAVDLQTRIQGYVTDGFLPSANGKFSPLTDQTVELAQANYLNFQDAGFEDKVKNFAVWSDVKMSAATSVNYPRYSGCGFTFRLKENGDAYTAMMIKDRVLLTTCQNSRCYELGKTKGTGTLSFQDSFQATLEVIVNDVHTYVLVDKQLIGEYTLSADKLIDPGYVAYSIISGTNKDYGTRCEYSNGGLWVPAQ